MTEDKDKAEWRGGEAGEIHGGLARLSENQRYPAVRLAVA
jgi:hypothetical protein